MMEYRQYKRYPTSDHASVKVDGAWHACSVQNLSSNGIFLETSCRPPIGTMVKFKLNTLGTYSGTVVRHAWDGIGITFNDQGPSDSAAEEEAPRAHCS